MKGALIIPILLLAGCLGIGSKEVYLPHTSRIFHAKKSCPGCNDINPIVFQSVQNALNVGGISPCNVCVKSNHYAVKGQGYSVTNYATSGTGGGTAGRFAPSSIGSTVLKVIKAGAQSHQDMAKNRRLNQPNWNQANAAYQMQQQTSIMQQQLDIQRAQQRQQRNSYTPITPIQPAPSVTNIYNTPKENKQWQPMESPFKGKNGILDGY